MFEIITFNFPTNSLNSRYKWIQQVIYEILHSSFQPIIINKNSIELFPCIYQSLVSCKISGSENFTMFLVLGVTPCPLAPARPFAPLPLCFPSPLIPCPSYPCPLCDLAPFAPLAHYLPHPLAACPLGVLPLIPSPLTFSPLPRVHNTS